MARVGIFLLGCSVAFLLALTTGAPAQPLLPQCVPELDGQVATNGCLCHHDAGGILTGRQPGWRWSCDLLRGGPPPDPAPADANPPSKLLPPGFVYAPHIGSNRTGGTGQQD